jgi:SPW repeat
VVLGLYPVASPWILGYASVETSNIVLNSIVADAVV